MDKTIIEDMMNLLAYLLLVVVVFVATGTFAQDARAEVEDGPAAITVLSLRAENLFSSSSYKELDKLFDQLNQPSERWADGRWKLDAVSSGLASFFSEWKTWPEHYKKIQDWKKANPTSKGAAITEAIYWDTYAWNARGGGYASTVTEEGWKLFKQRLSKAEQVLIKSKSYASENRLWYAEYLNIALGLGWSRDKYQALFIDAIRKEKYYYKYYFEMVTFLSPRWGGNYELVDQFIRDSVSATKIQEGHTLYARLYWIISQMEGEEVNLFTDTPASWDLMQQGFEDLMKRYPNSYWNLNNYASFSCRAGDKTTYAMLRPKLRDQIFHMAWPSNYSVDVCDQRLLEHV
jgi:hypothetical protein